MTKEDELIVAIKKLQHIRTLADKASERETEWRGYRESLEDKATELRSEIQEITSALTTPDENGRLPMTLMDKDQEVKELIDAL